MKKEPILLVDCIGSAAIVLNESSSSSACRFQGKFQEANADNKNKRRYTKESLERNVSMLMESIKNNGLYGELDHPTDSIVHLANASHMVTNLWWEGNVLMGEAVVLPTPPGRALKAILEAGGRVGISSRGVGNGQTNAEGILVIGESYKLITFDAVADPSTFDAYQTMKKVKRESIEEFVETNSSKVSADLLVGFFEMLLESELQKTRKKIKLDV